MITAGFETVNAARFGENADRRAGLPRNAAIISSGLVASVLTSNLWLASSVTINCQSDIPLNTQFVNGQCRFGGGDLVSYHLQAVHLFGNFLVFIIPNLVAYALLCEHPLYLLFERLSGLLAALLQLPFSNFVYGSNFIRLGLHFDQVAPLLFPDRAACQVSRMGSPAGGRITSTAMCDLPANQVHARLFVGLWFIILTCLVLEAIRFLHYLIRFFCQLIRFRIIPTIGHLGSQVSNPSELGIGGLDVEFDTVIRRALATRNLPADLVKQLNLKHTRGILLFGPPGTGKTLIARQMGKLLNARAPKIVNGPDILNKYVGESEANLRGLFEDAEAEYKRVGNNSALHLIIFDEIDAICKQRGSGAGGASGVHDNLVNQLLTKIDGVRSLNNVLIIGTTNRRDLVDGALLRPGRLEVQVEIGLPDEAGRLDILTICTASLRKYDKLGADVDLKAIAKLTSNFSGAELEGLVRAAESRAINKLVKASSTNKAAVDRNVFNKLSVNRNDFLLALNDIKPAVTFNIDEVAISIPGDKSGENNKNEATEEVAISIADKKNKKNGSEVAAKVRHMLALVRSPITAWRSARRRSSNRVSAL